MNVYKVSLTRAVQPHLSHTDHPSQDVLYSLQAVDNIEDIRRVYVLHILNHVLKSVTI